MVAELVVTAVVRMVEVLSDSRMMVVHGAVLG